MQTRAASAALTIEMEPKRTLAEIIAEAESLGLVKGTPDFITYVKDEKDRDLATAEKEKEIALATAKEENDRADRLARLKQEDEFKQKELEARLKQEEEFKLKELDAKVQQEEKELEAKLKHEKEIKQMELEHQAAHPTATTSAPTPRTKIPPPPPFDPKLERMDEFFQRFSSHVQVLGYSEVEKVVTLQNLLPPSDLRLIQDLPADLRFRFTEVKALLLDAHRITPAKLRTTYFDLRPNEGDNMSRYIRRTRQAFRAWIEACNVPQTYEGLEDFFITDRIYAILPAVLATHLREKCCDTTESVGTTGDTYLAARPTLPLSQLCLQRTNRQSTVGIKPNNEQIVPSRTPNQTNNGDHHSTGTWRQSQNNSPRRTNNNTYNNQSNQGSGSSSSPSSSGHSTTGTSRPRTLGTREARSWWRSNSNTPTPTSPAVTPRPSSVTSAPSGPPGCSLHGPNAFHTTANCVALKEKAASLNHLTIEHTQPDEPQDRGYYEQEAPMEPEHEPEALTEPIPEQTVNLFTLQIHPDLALPTCNGAVDGKPARVLLDSGADTVFVRASLIKPEQHTGQKIKVRSPCGSTIAPVVRFKLQCPHYRGDVTGVALTDSPTDIILGAIPGTTWLRDGVQDSTILDWTKEQRNERYPTLPATAMSTRNRSQNRTRTLSLQNNATGLQEHSPATRILRRGRPRRNNSEPLYIPPRSRTS